MNHLRLRWRASVSSCAVGTPPAVASACPSSLAASTDGTEASSTRCRMGPPLALGCLRSNADHAAAHAALGDSNLGQSGLHRPRAAAVAAVVAAFQLREPNARRP